MLRRALVICGSLLLAAACSSDSGDDFPIRPGGGGGGGGNGNGGTPDASAEPDAAVTAVTGSVCPILDFRFPTICDTTQSAAGIDIVEQVSGNTATTDSDGNYSIQTDGGTDATLVFGTGTPAVRPSVLPTVLTDGNASVQAPVMSAADYDALLLELGVVEPDDTASIVLYVVSGGARASGVNVVAPAGTTDTYYDSNEVVDFDLIGPTESLGTVVMFGVPPESGLVDFTVVRPDTTTIEVQGVPAVGNSTTLLTISID